MPHSGGGGSHSGGHSNHSGHSGSGGLGGYFGARRHRWSPRPFSRAVCFAVYNKYGRVQLIYAASKNSMLR